MVVDCTSNLSFNMINISYFTPLKAFYRQDSLFCIYRTYEAPTIFAKTDCLPKFFAPGGHFKLLPAAYQHRDQHFYPSIFFIKEITATVFISTANTPAIFHNG